MMPSQPDPHHLLPLTETTFYLLLSLASGPKHGYAMLKDIQELSHGKIVLTTGTLYGAIKRLVEQGWIERSDDPPGDPDGRVRKEYQLTLWGRRIFEAEFQRLKRLVVAAEPRVAGETL
jgi:DNA-binding PadR family transcriptional regulator